MSFKDFIASDFSTFINPGEFGEPHTINGETVTVVMDSDLIKGAKLPPRLSDGVYLNSIVFFVSEAELGYRPVEGELMRFDEMPCLVLDVADEMGMLAVTLEKNQS